MQEPTTDHQTAKPKYTRPKHCFSDALISELNRLVDAVGEERCVDWLAKSQWANFRANPANYARCTLRQLLNPALPHRSNMVAMATSMIAALSGEGKQPGEPAPSALPVAPAAPASSALPGNELAQVLEQIAQGQNTLATLVAALVEGREVRPATAAAPPAPVVPPAPSAADEHEEDEEFRHTGKKRILFDLLKAAGGVRYGIKKSEFNRRMGLVYSELFDRMLEANVDVRMGWATSRARGELNDRGQPLSCLEWLESRQYLDLALEVSLKRWGVG